MAEKKMMRLSRVATQLNVGIAKIIEVLDSAGHHIDNNPNAKLEFEKLEILAKELDAPYLLGSPKKEKIVAEPEVESEAEPDILYFREKEKEAEPEVIKIETSTLKPKVIGKIDLDDKGNVIPVKAEVPKEEKPVSEPKKEIKKAEEKPVETITPSEPVPTAVKEEKEEKKVEEKNEEKIEEPKEEVKAEVKTEEKKTEKPKIEAKKEQPKEEKTKKVTQETKKAKPAAKVIQEPEEDDEEPELIKAQGDKLQGLTVLGKIELPVDKKPSKKEERKKRKRKRVIKGGEKVGDTSSKSSFDNVKAKAPQKPTQQDPRKKTEDAKPGRRRKKDRRRGHEEVSESDVRDNIRSTISRMHQKGKDFGARYRKEKRRHRAEIQDAQDQQELEESHILKVTEFVSAAELASLMDVSVNEVIATCMSIGIFASINQRLDAETIQLIAMEFDFEVEFISAEDELAIDAEEIEDAEEDLEPRAPIVTIMGHVDHGKTSLLDYIRRARVASGESGGITQHIGAYSVTIKEGPNKGKSITFLDTPGHEAFTAMRARGAKITDVVIIVIAADDSVMPQTKEAINHAKNAGVPIVFALNKVDKPTANPEKIKEDLTRENILVESWGGKYQDQEVSAKSGLGIDELLDKVLLEAELLELKANPDRNSVGTVIEASLDKGRGYLSTILVQNGTLKIGDIILAGQHFGRVRAMISDMGERVEEAGPSTPIQILGLPGAPQAGDRFNIMESEREAREIANKREQLNREMSIRARKHITLDEIGRRKAIGTFEELNLVIKGDVDGSVEALSDSLLKLSTEEVQVNIIHKGVGQISESDVTLASAADAIVVGFQVRPSVNARRIAENEEIEIRTYSIIYDAINEIKDAMEGLLTPTEEEVVTGNIEVREVFKISKVGTIAGSYVTDGYVKRNNKVRIIREGIVIHEGQIAQLRRFKDDVSEVKEGYECGISIERFNDIQIGDIIESFEIREIKRTL